MSNRSLNRAMDAVCLALALTNPYMDFVGWKTRSKSSALGYFASRNQDSNLFLWNRISLESLNVVCEVGANSGPRLFGLAQQYPEKNFIGLDLNEVAVHVGNQKSRMLQLNNLTFELIDIRKRQFSNYLKAKQCDLIISWATLIYVHPWIIKRLLRSFLVSASQIVLIEQIEEKKKSSIIYFRNNLKWKHNYRAIFQEIAVKEKIMLTIEEDEVPPEIWNPGGGNAKFMRVIRS